MDINLEKIDTIRERTGVSYRVAKEILEKHNGDLVEALIDLEEKDNDKNWTESMNIMGNDVIEKLKRVIKKGNVTRVILKKDGNVLLNVPVTAGAIGVVLAPFVSIVGVSAALVSRATIEIVKDNGDIVDINDIAEEKMNDVRNKFSKQKDNVVDVAEDFREDVTEDIDETLDDLNNGSDY